MNWPLHGANAHHLYESLELPMPDKIIDFSANLNPFGPPAGIQANWSDWFEKISDFPDPNGKELVQQIAREEGLSEDTILLGNGGAELIALVTRMLAGKRVLLIHPTFSEYGRMCSVAGCEMTSLVLQEGDWQLRMEELIPKLAEADAVFLCHPNNPTGIVYSESLMEQIISACHEHNCLLIADEAFYDFLDNKQSVASLVNKYSNLMVIRSLTKMYAIAGLRLGYLLASPELVRKLKSFQPHWSVNALALEAGKECLLDGKHAAKTRSFISGERERILAVLKKAGYRVSPSKVNFHLLQDRALDEQLPLFRFLLKKGIVPRHTANYQGLNGRWMRFAVKQSRQNDILLEALLEWRTHN
ncbi:threonine-phosphate decarboxylase CobD [Virgibacillus ihumii]|uniref:threonine-phosphate decarboxylase CobD n=1 Tax=Virgibacillus ihumii TaxID=2686091 RepID=UPI00157DF9D3|nr:threonine-phosphate decarboxylase CobD [Virgibacillus ihumii]